MTGTDPKAVVTRYVEAVRDGDLPAIRDSFAHDATWTYPGDLPISGTYEGRTAILEDFLGSVGPLIRPGTTVIELTHAFADGDQVLAEWTSTATTVDGAAYANRCAGVFTVRDGRIAAVREYADTRHAADVLFPAHRR
ncbi:nuclear transport factor 2 family protein [Streptomyces sp. M-16]|uniref:nuclear transport factor 2 family protein n=1 Tax=Streptomyces sp. M-16 TaxID=3233040 RepID=UPI0022506D95